MLHILSDSGPGQRASFAGSKLQLDLAGKISVDGFLARQWSIMKQVYILYRTPEVTISNRARVPTGQKKSEGLNSSLSAPQSATFVC